MIYWAFLFAALVILLFVLKRDHTWFYGMYQTVSAIVFARRPSIFNQIVKDEIQAPDGERYAVWWSSKTDKHFNKTIKTHDTTNDLLVSDSSSKIWIILPGGMTTADTFYTWDAIKSGLFDDEPWCIFHNPGIINKCYKRSPPGLTETTYLEHLIQMLKRQGRQISVIGFSAGSMLTIAIAKKADELDDLKGSNDKSKTLDCCVAVHGPDKIRDVFEYFYHETYSRLDILFSLSLYTTMCKSGCTQFLPLNAGGGLHKNKLVWLSGWSWMKAYTEDVFQSPWHKMEESLRSCDSALSTPIITPVMRVLSLNDPIVDFSRCCNPRNFSNVDKVYFQPKAGHCCAFRYDKDLATHIKRWRNQILERNDTKKEN